MSGDLCAALKEFADNMAPPESLVNEVGRIIDRLSHRLHSNAFIRSRYIDRIVPVGSYGKKTSLRFMMDLDIVMFLNDEQCPFTDFVSDLEDFITLQDSYTNCKVVTNGISFLAEGTLHVDLKLATNRCPRDESSRGKKARDIQRNRTLEVIEKSPKPFDEGWKQSTALSETAVEFVKYKNKEHHCSTLARLAKFWNKTICIESFHSGRSTIMELIAIRSAEEVQRRGRENTLLAFRKFLNKISNVEQMSIYWTEYYDERRIQLGIKYSRPLLLDPTNPYNNILRGKNKTFMLQMAENANISQDRLGEAECCSLRDEPVNLRILFKPQPEWQYLPLNVRQARKAENFFVGITDGGGLLMPKTVTSIDERDREIVENMLFAFTETTATDARKTGNQNVASKVKEDVKNMLAPNASWKTGSEPLKADVKIKIPFVDEHGRSKTLTVTFDIK